MTISDFREHFTNSLSSIYSKDEVNALFFIVLEYVLKMNRAQVALSPHTKLSTTTHVKLDQILVRLSNNEPIQYIVGETNFAGLTIQLSSEVLIPRPETESRVYWVQYQESKGQEVLDICAGSGCIAFALEKLIEAKVTAWDISTSALTTAKKTAKELQSSVVFSKVDILSQKEENRQWDIIVSNPPYVLREDITMMHENVLRHEPHLALFTTDKNRVQFYAAVAAFSQAHLKPRGRLYFELNPKTANEVVSLLKMMEFDDIVVAKDMQGKDRMLRATKKT
jgi:release factor glutamine methyltransferase